LVVLRYFPLVYVISTAPAFRNFTSFVYELLRGTAVVLAGLLAHLNAKKRLMTGRG